MIEEIDDDANPAGVSPPTLDSFTQEFVSLYYRVANSIWRLGCVMRIFMVFISWVGSANI